MQPWRMPEQFHVLGLVCTHRKCVSDTGSFSLLCSRFHTKKTHFFPLFQGKHLFPFVFHRFNVQSFYYGKDVPVFRFQKLALFFICSKTTGIRDVIVVHVLVICLMGHLLNKFVVCCFPDFRGLLRMLEATRAIGERRVGGGGTTPLEAWPE